MTAAAAITPLIELRPLPAGVRSLAMPSAALTPGTRAAMSHWYDNSRKASDGAGTLQAWVRDHGPDKTSAKAATSRRPEFSP